MNKQVANTGVPKTLSEDTIKDLIEVQRSKIALELKQTEVALKEIEHNGKIADKSIEAQKEDRKDAREKQVQSERNGFIFAGAVVFFITLFAYAALQIGKDAVILDMVKVLIGFAGGYGIGRAAQTRKDKKEENEDSDD
jgi:Flp pilus assembly protein TadB